MRIQVLLKGLSCLGFLTALTASSFAADAEYTFTQEFVDVCGESQISYKNGKKSFTEGSWIETNSAMNEALDPAFYLNHVKAYKAYQKDLPDGGAWYGTMSKGKLQNYNVRMCNLWLITDDISDIRSDFENVIQQEPSQKVKVEGEDRFIYLPEGATEFHFAQEADAGDGKFVIILSKVFAGK